MSESLPDDSAIWSSLFTLESVRSYTPVQQEPSRTFHPLSAPPTDPDKLKEFRLNKRHQKLASAVAFIGASSPDLKTVTACSSEISFPTDVKQPNVTLRVAQNQLIPEADMERFRDLLDVLRKEVCKVEGWNVKDDRDAQIERIADTVLLPLVVARCRTKICSILSEPYSKPFRNWYTANNLSDSFLDGVPTDLQDALGDYFSVINGASDLSQRNDETIKHAIISAHRIVSAGVTTKFSFEQRWTKYDTPAPPPTVIEENLDDYETLDEEDCRKSVIHRFLHKLGRYHSTCRVIVRELVTLRRSGHDLNIAIERVPMLYTNGTPLDEREYPDLDSFFLDRIHVDTKTLGPKKLDRLRSRWRTVRKNGVLILHAEMQLVLFYASNPQIFPIQGYIGVSKNCCWCCNFVLKHLQNTRKPSVRDEELDRYTVEAAGPPLIFSVGGTHGTKYPLWIFPDPSKHIQSHMLEQSALDKVRRRFELVREDLQEALVNQVRDLVPALRKPEYESDSSGLSDDSDATMSEVKRDRGDPTRQLGMKLKGKR